MTRKPEQETKQRILLAAKKEFARFGFAGARMDNIAKKAKANKAMIHYYFGSKEKLYGEVLFFLVGNSPPESLPLSEMKNHMSATEKMACIIYFMVNIHLECVDEDFSRMMDWDAAEGNRHGKTLAKKVFTPAMERLEAVIAEGVQSGEFETRNPTLEVWSLVSFVVHYRRSREAFKGLPFQKKLYPENGASALIDFLTQHALKALAPGKKDTFTISPEVKTLLDDKIEQMRNRKTI